MEGRANGCASDPYDVLDFDKLRENRPEDLSSLGQRNLGLTPRQILSAALRP